MSEEKLNQILEELNLIHEKISTLTTKEDLRNLDEIISARCSAINKLVNK